MGYVDDNMTGKLYAKVDVNEIPDIGDSRGAEDWW
jgi:hypothetical protein